MATWHQMRGGRKLVHSTRWHLCIDPPGEMRYGYLFPTQLQATAALAALPDKERQHAFILAPEFPGRDFEQITIREPAHGKNRERYRTALERVLDDYTRFVAVNPSRARCLVKVRWTGHEYAVVAGFSEEFTGGFMPVARAYQGRTVRLTRKWADVGLPDCPQDGRTLELEGAP